MSSFAAKSQTSDTLCFQIPVIQKVLIAAKQKSLADSLNVLLRSDIAILQNSVHAHQVKDSLNREIIGGYVAMTGTMRDQRQVLETQIGVLNKEVRRWKRKTTLAAAGGLLLTGLTTFLFILK